MNKIFAPALCVFFLAGCSLIRKDINFDLDPNDPERYYQEETVLLSEFKEYRDRGVELMEDSLWFEASNQFDSALIELGKLDSIEYNTPHFNKTKRRIRDQLYSYLIRCTYYSSQMQINLPWAEIWEEEMEQVTDSQLTVMDSLSLSMPGKKYGLPVHYPLNPRITKAMAVLTSKGKKYFSKWLNRKSRYESMIQGQLAQAGLPRELIYLAMVESGFSPKAWSRAKASGVWQFIKSTGKIYGLNSDWWVDERRDPVKSTAAAIKFLTKLYKEFGDWHMAMAAYNCGEGCIRRNLRQDSTLTYWDMKLPRETENYVPKILAAMIVGENAEKYGFVIEPEAEVAFDTVTVKHCLSLNVIAKASSSEESELQFLNPELKRWCTPPNTKSYLLKLPKGTREQFVKNYSKLDKSKLVSWHRHRVRSGENLSVIADNYGVSIRALKSTNNLRRNLIRVGQQLLVPIPPSKDYPKEKKSRKQKIQHRVYKNKIKYQVKSGDNLYDISRSFDVPLVQLIQANKLSFNSIIKPGETIWIPVVKSGNKPRKLSTHHLKYKVRPGDNLWDIAQKLGVSVSELKSWNNLTHNRLKIGQMLKYEVKGAISKGGQYYEIKPRDNLWDIARKFNMTVKKLQELNPGLPKILKPGMKVRIK